MEGDREPVAAAFGCSSEAGIDLAPADAWSSSAAGVSGDEPSSPPSSPPDNPSTADPEALHELDREAEIYLVFVRPSPGSTQASPTRRDATAWPRHSIHSPYVAPRRRAQPAGGDGEDAGGRSGWMTGAAAAAGVQRMEAARGGDDQGAGESD